MGQCVPAYAIVLNHVTPYNPVPGSIITISGANFRQYDPLRSFVQLNGTNLVTIVSWNDTQILAVLPPFAATGMLQVITYNGPSNNVTLYIRTRHNGGNGLLY